MTDIEIGDWVASVEVLRLQPGDVLLITTTGRLDQQEAARLRATIMAALPDDYPVLVADEGTTFAIARRSPEVVIDYDTFEPIATI